MSDKTNKAKQAAATRVRNQLQQDEANKKLIESTLGPRNAKTKALSNAVWNSASNKRAASPIEESTKERRKSKKTKGVAKQTISQEEDVEEAPSALKVVKSKEKMKLKLKTPSTGKLTSNVQRIPAARINSDSGSEDQEVVLAPRVHSKPRVSLGTTKHCQVPSHTGSLEVNNEVASDEKSDSAVESETEDSQSFESDEDDLMHVDSKTLQKMLADEQPAILEREQHSSAQGLFDDLDFDNTQEGVASSENDVDMLLVTERSSRRSSMSSHYSVPPTTDSDQDIVKPELDEESDEPDANPKVRHRRSVSANMTRRGKAFLAEKPSVQRSVPPKFKEKNSTAATTNSEWPTHATLVLPPTGKGLLLTEQHCFIGQIVRGAITALTRQTLLDDAFIDADKKVNYHRVLLLQAARKVRSTFFPAGDIYDRLKIDTQFCDALGKLVTDRLPVIRGPVKTNASVEIAAYELGVGSRCIERVEALYNRKVYIFPGSWTIDPKTKKEQWKYKADKPFLISVISDVLRSSFFNTPRAPGYSILSDCVSSLDGHDEPELPLRIVALAGTGIYAALYEWKTGSKVAAKFEGNVFATIYKALCRDLEGIKAQNVKAYHAIMSELYLRVIKKVTTEESEDALELIDLSSFV